MIDTTHRLSTQGIIPLNGIQQKGGRDLRHRRRPEYAWGLLALPEFWLVPLFLVATIFSIRRDRRRLSG